MDICLTLASRLGAHSNPSYDNALGIVREVFQEAGASVDKGDADKVVSYLSSKFPNEDVVADVGAWVSA